MSTKEAHVLAFWRAKLRELERERGRPVTAGELARHVGQARSTAARYLKRLSSVDKICSDVVQFPNGMMGLVYRTERLP